MTLRRFWRWFGRLWHRLRRSGPGHASAGASLQEGVPRPVLVVDPDGRAGPALAQSLARSGLLPRVVREDGAALEALGRQRTAAVIVAGRADPGLYRALRRATPAPLLALAPQAGDEDVLEAFAAGVDQFLYGPVSPAEVVARVLALLRRG